MTTTTTTIGNFVPYWMRVKARSPSRVGLIITLNEYFKRKSRSCLLVRLSKQIKILTKDVFVCVPIESMPEFTHTHPSKNWQTESLKQKISNSMKSFHKNKMEDLLICFWIVRSYLNCNEFSFIRFGNGRYYKFLGLSNGTERKTI